MVREMVREGEQVLGGMEDGNGQTVRQEGCC